mmetsp:Transcript_55524/g.132719  ORF Transcript_55524/g.132719 Transcript_55524/m.132719 type:complete len:263 (-) Transcript_55524:1601-2389(-)
MTLLASSSLASPWSSSGSSNFGSPGASSAFTMSSNSSRGMAALCRREKQRATRVRSVSRRPLVMASGAAPPSTGVASSRLRFWPRFLPLPSVPSVPSSSSSSTGTAASGAGSGTSSSRAASINLNACSTSSTRTKSLRSFSFAWAVARRIKASRVRVVTANLGFRSALPSLSSAKPLWNRILISTYFSETAFLASSLSTGAKRLAYLIYFCRKSTVTTCCASCPSTGIMSSKSFAGSSASFSSLRRSRMLEWICSTPRLVSP